MHEISTAPGLRPVRGLHYNAIRFGLRNRGDNWIPDRRPCDTGLSQPHECVPTFVPHYRPHSFLGEGPPGAWRLLPGKQVYIHEGANSARNVIGGSLGCIEVVDGGWRQFQNEIQSKAGGSCAAIGAAKKLKVTIEYAAYPMAKLY